MTFYDPQTSRIVAFASALDRVDARVTCQLLGGLKGRDLRRWLFVAEPMKGTKAIKIQTAEALFPERFVALRNMVTLAMENGVQSDIYRDGFEMLALENLYARDVEAALVLVRGHRDFKEPVQRWMQDPAALQGDAPPFLCLTAPGASQPHAVAFRPDHPGFAAFVRIGAELYCSGAICGLSDYSLRRALDQSWAAVLRL